MKIQAFTFFFLISIGAFAQTSTEKIEIVQNYLDAAFSKDTNTQMSLMSEEIIDYHPTVLAPPAKGKEELIMGWNNTMNPLDSVVYSRTGSGIVELQDGEFQGEWVLETGMVKMKFPGVEKWIELQMVGLYQVENGLITVVRNFGNMLDLYQQMGYTLTSPGGK